MGAGTDNSHDFTMNGRSTGYNRADWEAALPPLAAADCEKCRFVADLGVMHRKPGMRETFHGDGGLIPQPFGIGNLCPRFSHPFTRGP